MPNNWTACRWGDVATLEYGKALRNYNDGSGAYPVFGTNGPIGLHSEPLCKQPSVIIGRKGAYRGVHYSDKPFWVIDTAFYLNPKMELDTRWAYYQLLTQDINTMDSGSAIPSTSRGDFYNLRLQLPPLHEQRAIVGILGALDDKIELNRRMNETLESMARALFQSWFVDFDPVHAQVNGRQTFGMDAGTAALFPCAFADSPLGKIPEGWSLGGIRDFCQRVENGGTPRRTTPAYWLPGQIHWLTSGEVRQRIVTRTENYISLDGLKNSSAKLWPCGTTVVALYGATAGQVCLLAIETSANQACCGLIPKTDARCYLYFGVSTSITELEQQARGSAQQNLSQDIVACHRLILPPVGVLEAFERISGPLVDKMVAALKENDVLAALRDTLLPKLMSGEVRVSDAEKLVEAAL